MESLTRLLMARRENNSPVAIRPDSLYTWGQFQAHVAGWCEQLSTQPKGRWLLYSQSSYTFAVGLFALWQTGRVAVLPPNQQKESLAEASEGVGGTLTDETPLVVGKSRRWKELSLSRPCLELFTSGSTGERQVVTKTLAQLQSEIAVLEKTFSDRMGSCAVYSTVPHQHIYGLLFRLLWPLSVGRPFADDTALLWEELGPRLKKSPTVCLVTSPSHLERISLPGKKALEAAQPRVIFSSGGPLQNSAISWIREKCGQAPVEVFGSTETGGVGWRQKNKVATNEDWTPLRGVSISSEKAKGDGRFLVRSPFVSQPKGKFLMGDYGLVFKSGKFRLEGRVDRIVKIAEKRLSLDDMERRLARHSWVAQAKIVVLPSHNGTVRQSLGAVIVLKPQGRSQLQRAGRAALASAFRQHLGKSFDVSTLPRAFRFIDALPHNLQGKLSHSTLLTLFQSRFDRSLTTPERIRVIQTKSHLRLRLRVPEDLAYLEGHFSEHPIVPGIVQLRWVVDGAAEWMGRRIAISRMEAVKFKNLLLPGRFFWLVVEKDTSGAEQVLRFSLAEKKTSYSSGRLVLA